MPRFAPPSPYVRRPSHAQHALLQECLKGGYVRLVDNQRMRTVYACVDSGWVKLHGDYVKITEAGKGALARQRRQPKDRDPKHKRPKAGEFRMACRRVGRVIRAMPDRPEFGYEYMAALDELKQFAELVLKL